MQPEALRAALEDPAFKRIVFDFMENLMTAQLPGGHFSSSALPDAAYEACATDLERAQLAKATMKERPEMEILPEHHEAPEYLDDDGVPDLDGVPRLPSAS